MLSSSSSVLCGEGGMHQARCNATEESEQVRIQYAGVQRRHLQEVE